MRPLLIAVRLWHRVLADARFTRAVAKMVPIRYAVSGDERRSSST
jgi:hypothetical protein